MEKDIFKIEDKLKLFLEEEKGILLSEITSQKIFEKLQQLDGYLSNLKKLKKGIKSLEEFLEDFHLYGLAERYLQLSCQVVPDTLN